MDRPLVDGWGTWMPLLCIAMLAASLFLVGYANGVADAAFRYQQSQMEAIDG